MKKENLLSALFVAALVFLVASRVGDRREPSRSATDEVIETSLPFLITEQPQASAIAVFDTNSSVVLAKYLWKVGALADKNIHHQWAMASLTKLMTAVVAEENINPSEQIFIDEESWATEGTAGGFLPGEIFSARDLIEAMMVVSSNDVAEALAKTYGKKRFIEAMRQKAEELGMSNTNYADVTGLSSLNQSTAADLEKLVRYIYFQHPEIFDFSRQREADIIELKSKIKRKLVNINKFAGENDFLGGKTGFTEEAGGNLISLFQYQSQPLLIMVFGAEDRFAETEKVFNWITSR